MDPDEDEKLLPNLESLQLRNVDPIDLGIAPIETIKLLLMSRRRFDLCEDVFFTGPPDTLKELVITFLPASRRKEFVLEEHAAVRMFRQHGGVTFTIGPRFYR